MNIFRKITSKKHPQEDDLLRSNFILNENTSFAVSEAYRSARTNLRFVTPAEGCSIIASTSALPNEGKTVTCINLAVSLAENNHKVLLIDADMRKPRIASTLGLEMSPGLSDILAGFVKNSEDDNLCRQKTHIKNLDVIAAGKNPPNPSELLASPRMQKLLDKLSAEYDYIMLDTPPSLVVTDALVLKPYIYGYIFVVRSGLSRTESIKELITGYNRAEARICGVILNAQHKKHTRHIRYGKYGAYGKYQ